MNTNDLDNYILNLLKTNSKGISIEVIIDYLDYMNKVRYSESEIIEIVYKLIKEGKIIKVEKLFILK